MIQDLFCLNEHSVGFSSHHTCSYFLFGTLGIALFVFCAGVAVPLQPGVVCEGHTPVLETVFFIFILVFVSVTILLFFFFPVFSQGFVFVLLFYAHF